jgi:hypothetical protein
MEGKQSSPCLFLVLGDLMPNDAANCSASDRADSTATGEHRAAYCADPGADCGVLLLCRHAAASRQRDQYRYSHDRATEYVSHVHSLPVKVGAKVHASIT